MLDLFRKNHTFAEYKITYSVQVGKNRENQQINYKLKNLNQDEKFDKNFHGGRSDVRICVRYRPD